MSKSLRPTGIGDSLNDAAVAVGRPINLLELPTEILLLILEVLLRIDPVTLLTIPGVNKRFKQLAVGVRGGLDEDTTRGIIEQISKGDPLAIAPKLSGFFKATVPFRRFGLTPEVLFDFTLGELAPSQIGDVVRVDSKISPLLFACKYGLVKVVQKFLDLGANVNHNGPENNFPLLFACEGFINTDLLRLLLDRGAEINRENEWHQTPLLVALLNRYDPDFYCATLLLDRGADVNRKIGGTPLMAMCQLKLGSQDLLRKEEIHERIKFLLDRGADVNIANMYGNTPLFVACDKGYADIVRLLLDRDAEINILNVNQKSPLFVACEGGYVDIVRLLLERGGNTYIDTQGNLYGTPLVVACGHKFGEIAELLLQYGANPNQQDVSGATPLLLACRKGLWDIVKLLLDRNADVNTRDNVGCTPLNDAIAQNFPDVRIFELLIDRGADVNAKEGVDGMGREPLGWAIECNRGDIFDLLIRRGADVNSVDRHGKTLYERAVSMNRPDLATKLMSAGAETPNPQ